MQVKRERGGDFEEPLELEPDPPDGFKDVYVTPDRTPEERGKGQKAVVEVKRLPCATRLLPGLRCPRLNAWAD